MSGRLALHALGCLASTGPRLRSRGMEPPWSRASSLHRLQRGLGFEAEEWRFTRATGVGKFELQRGLGFEAEECV